MDLYRERKLYDINSKRLAWMLEERERNCKTSRRLVRMLGHGGGGERERTDRQTETERDSDRDTHREVAGVDVWRKKTVSRNCSPVYSQYLHCH